MKIKVWLFLLLLAAIGMATIRVFSQIRSHNSFSSADQYVCTPCGLDCDQIVVDGPGTCMNCQMKLIKKSAISFHEILPGKLCQYIQSHPKTILLDVRTKKEFEGKSFPDYGTLKNAINIPIQELEARLKELNTFKETEIIVYCSHSQRSPRASFILTQNGFKKVVNMAGGMSKLEDDSCKR